MLPEGFVVPVADATARGFQIVSYPWLGKERVARQHPDNPEMVIVPGGFVLGKLEAKLGQFVLPTSTGGTPSLAAQPSIGVDREWRRAIMTAPETVGRESAAADLLANHSHATMSIDQARALLRGLPIEAPDEAANAAAPKDIDPRAARLAEISANMRAFNRDRGYANIGKLPAAKPGNIDPTKLKRLAEIRLGALTMRIQAGETALSAERRELAYALSVHEETGQPLTNVFRQRGIDTSTMIKGNR